MERTFLKALSIVLISLGIAIIFNSLFFDKLIGISVFIFTVILLGALFVFGSNQKLYVRKIEWLVLLIVFFALMPAIRANEFLTFLNICTLLGLLMLLAYELVGTPVFLMRLRDYLTLMILGPLRMLKRGLSTLSFLGQSHSTVKRHDAWRHIVKGAIMSLPVLFVFGLLFSQADLAFSQFIGSFFDMNISERTLQYLSLLFFAFIATTGFFSYIFFPKQAQPTISSELSHAPVQPGKRIEVFVFLGLISALFLLFISFQITYLFGGEANILDAGFTYAEYARRGFWELLAVAMLSLAILLACEKYTRGGSKNDKWFSIPALLMIAEVMIVIVSAFKRLSLYMDTYGMTELRFYVFAFIGLLCVLFILLAVKFIRSKPEEFFAFGTLLSALVFLIGINSANPHAYIIKTNVERYEQSRTIDFYYMGTLSSDAIPWKIELYGKLKGDDKAALRGLLEEERDRLEREKGSWQSANLSRAQALKLLSDF